MDLTEQVLKSSGTYVKDRNPLRKISFEMFRPYFDVSNACIISNIKILLFPFIDDKYLSFNVNLFLPIVSILFLLAKPLVLDLIFGNLSATLKLSKIELVSIFFTKIMVIQMISISFYKALIYVFSVKIPILRFIAILSFKYFYLLFFESYKKIFVVLNIYILICQFFFTIKSLKTDILAVYGENKRLLLIFFGISEIFILFLLSIIKV